MISIQKKINRKNKIMNNLVQKIKQQQKNWKIIFIKIKTMMIKVIITYILIRFKKTKLKKYKKSTVN